MNIRQLFSKAATRMHWYGLLALALCVAVFALFGENVVTRLVQIVFLVVKLAVGGYLGYLLHKAIFRDFRPKALTTQRGTAYMYSRAVVVAAAMIGAGFVT